MKIGIYTPIHKINETELEFLFKSIYLQKRKPDAWVLLLNGKAKSKADKIFEIADKNGVSSFIRVCSSDTMGNIGSLKNEASFILIELGMDILVELDYDDYLRADCLELLEKNARNYPDAVFFYSNFAHFKFLEDGLVESMYYSAHWGWKKKNYKDEDVFGSAILNEMISFPAKPQFLARIESAPNHMRAFRASPYKKINHDKNLCVGDDHDIICRIFIEHGEKGFCHIDECLYYQRMGETTTKSHNDLIQNQVKVNYIKYVESLYKKWSEDNNLDMLDLGGRFNSPEGYISVDLLDADWQCDLNTPTWFPIKPDTALSKAIEDNSVGIIRAYHLVEHLDNPINFFNEVYRILAPGGLVLMEVPSLNHPMAFADPTHKSFWSELNFLYFTNEKKANFIRPQYKGAFLPVRVEEYPWQDGTLVISAQLTALKGWYNETWWGDKQTDESYII